MKTRNEWAPSGLRVPYLQQWRIWAALSREELANLAGVHKVTIQDIEQGGEARFSTIGKLSDALGISRQKLIHSQPKNDAVAI